MSRSKDTLGLAASRSISFGSSGRISTPLVVPSFSSKGFPKVKELVAAATELITDSVLVSAYDIYHELVPTDLRFATVIFLDSGGYEVSKDAEFSDLGVMPSKPRTWDADKHRTVLDAWKGGTRTVAISFDHPKHRMPIKKQISEAMALLKGRSVASEILIKPETANARYINVEAVVGSVKALRPFSVVGLTEKELGPSPLERLHNIFRIRTALQAVGIDVPIHIFGSLDTISTPLYFLAGADIFDGLTWLRFAYRDGRAVYKRNAAALMFEPNLRDDHADDRILVENYLELTRLQGRMNRFLNERSFAEFGEHGRVFEKICKDLTSEIRKRR